MAKSFALNANHDIEVIDGKILTVEDVSAIGQHIKTRLLMYRGEYPFDNLYGFPYIVLLGSRTINLKELETEIKQYILETEGVVKFTQFSFDYQGGNSRTLIITFSVQTTLGSEINMTLEPIGSRIKVNHWRESWPE